MKTLPGILTLASLFIAVTDSAAALEIPWSTIDGGGATSSGGTFAISGTIGQPDAGVSTSGNFSVQGGFWNEFTAGTESTPRLSIVKSGANVLISWPRPATGFLLEWSPAVEATGLWNAVGFPYATGTTHISRSEPATGGPRYYRLKK